MGERASEGAGRLEAGRTRCTGRAVRNQVALSGGRGDGIGAGRSAAQGAPVGVAEAATGRLDVGARSLAAGCVVMERQRVQTRQAGSSRQKNGEEK